MYATTGGNYSCMRDSGSWLVAKHIELVVKVAESWVRGTATAREMRTWYTAAGDSARGWEGGGAGVSFKNNVALRMQL